MFAALIVVTMILVGVLCLFAGAELENYLCRKNAARSDRYTVELDGVEYTLVETGRVISRQTIDNGIQKKIEELIELKEIK